MEKCTKRNDRFRAAFEGWCIKLLVSAYQEVLTKKSIGIDYKENDISMQLNKCIEHNQLRLDKHIVSHVEARLPNVILPETRGYADKCSRIDMRFVVFKKSSEYKYYAEAKILKEHDSSLNRRYIDTGIDNFLSGKYYNGCLLAYIMSGDLSNIIETLNRLLTKDGRASEILLQGKCRIHKEYYESKHCSIDLLKHFMFDFAKIEDETHPHP